MTVLSGRTPTACGTAGLLIQHAHRPCGMILAMPKRSSQRRQFEVTCPCCGGLLTIDAENHAVIGHVAAERPKTFGDLDEAARAMHEQEGRRDSIFRQSVEAERQRGDLLEKKFQEALRRAKESPDIDKPLIRDFDLD